MQAHSLQALAPVLSRIEQAVHQVIALSREVPQAQLAIAGQYWLHATPIHDDKAPVLGFADDMIWMDDQIHSPETAINALARRAAADADGQRTEHDSLYVYPASEQDLSICFEVDIDEQRVEAMRKQLRDSDQLAHVTQFARNYPVTESQPFKPIDQTNTWATEFERQTLRKRYSMGGCFELALAAAAEIPGATLGVGGYVEPGIPPQPTHGFVYLPDDKVLDIFGPQSTKQMEARLIGGPSDPAEPSLEAPWHKPVSKDELIDTARYNGIDISPYEVAAARSAFLRVNDISLEQVAEQFKTPVPAPPPPRAR